MQIQQVPQRTAIGQKKYRKPYFAEDSGLWYLGDLEHGNIYVTHTPSDTLYDENGNAIDPSEIKKEIFFKWRATVLC